ncbi:class Ib ribonucleoside-diphosphate reductase assembly flavoprotein NrdI [Paenibacillus naphthalenovorans]|uniref:Ribonucleotide reductase stimulatory protein n=1 Tax=Paenibacillus naphthalenovorans TaxID=162209 RepID=A0A0U2MW99_9BACL|nr:class Ib ribonucleoside-diphosphate reductase assembly flavoprotein NrdI [Paenibacillus naphthalenovorans]ALS22111.1 ribonucleotide reductase stimulatory protein [Paenibacillus naphthalenovorans]
MLVVYDSMTGNVERFVKKLGVKNVKIHKELIVNEPFILITYTTGFGQLPQSTTNFLSKNNRYIIAVASSGNRNWGKNYGFAAELISKQYDVPIILKFELSGTEDDIKIFTQEMQKFV